MARDPGMRVGRIRSADIVDKFGPCGCRWDDHALYDLDKIYEDNTITLDDLMNLRTLQYLPGKDADSVPDFQDNHDAIMTVLDPALVGEKVFACMLADIAGRRLREFEAGPYATRAPRNFVRGVRSFGLGFMGSAILSDLLDAAYEGENSRADVTWAGKILLAPRGTKEFWDWLGWLGEYLKRRHDNDNDDLQDMLDRFKEFDVGTVDLTDEDTSEPENQRELPAD